MLRLLAFSVCGIVIASTASAHTGVGDTAGFAHGFLHPIGGPDHVLAMVAVGLFAATLGGRALWLVPLSFLTMMAAGGAIGIGGVDLPLVELGIGFSSRGPRRGHRGALENAARCCSGVGRLLRDLSRTCARGRNAEYRIRNGRRCRLSYRHGIAGTRAASVWAVVRDVRGAAGTASCTDCRRGGGANRRRYVGRPRGYLKNRTTIAARARRARQR